MDLTIRKATAADAASAWTVRAEAIRHACKGFYPADLLERWTEGDLTDEFAECVAERFYVATIDASVVGIGSINPADSQLDAIFVRPDRMGQGIGRRLVAFCEELARSAGLTDLKLDATLNAAPFYRRCGFVGNAVSVYHSPRGISLECVPMRKRIARPGPA